jgi:hypothetical protein
LDIQGESSCLRVTDCTFADQKGTHGGAVYMRNGTPDSDIEYSTFHNCSATRTGASESYGGALDLCSDTTTLTRCCGRDCWAKDYGQFLCL